MAGLPHLVALVSFIGRSSRRVREDVGLGVLVGPELLLSLLQHHGGLHHVLFILVLIEASPQDAGIEAILVSGRDTDSSKSDSIQVSE